MIELRGYQNDQVEGLRSGFRAGIRRQLLVSPTGSGKGIVFSFMATAAAEKGLKVLVLAHRSEILDQIFDNLQLFGIKAGQIRSGMDSDASKPVQVASVQTLVRRFDSTPVPDLVIVDEAHHSAAETWKLVFEKYPKAKWVGTTATPQRLDGRGLREYFDAIVPGPSVSWLIDQGYLKRPVYFAPSQAVDLSGIKKVAGDYAKGELAEVMGRSSLTGNAVAEYLKRGRGVPAVVFAVNLKHAASIAAEFNERDIQAEVIEGKMSPEERRLIKSRMIGGGTKVLVSVDLVSEGYDLPAVGCAILLRPTQSLSLHLQQLGRPLRPTEGQPNAIILDHAGNLLRHGLAEEPREWSLDGHAAKKRSEEAILATVQCPQCYAIGTAPICAECGFVKPVKQRVIRQQEGELKLIEEAQAREKYYRKREEWACKSLMDWQALAKRRGYAPGFAWYRWSNSRNYAARKMKQPVMT